MTDYYEAAQYGSFEEKGFSFGPESDGPDTGDTDWIVMKPPKTGVPPEVADFKEGWAMFHLSVHPKDVERAWNIAVDEMLKDPRIFHKARVAASGAVADFAKTENPHAGKMIAIYTNAFYGDDKYAAANYLSLLQRIEDRLHAANIRRGLPVKGDKQIPGSAFISYRGESYAKNFNDVANPARDGGDTLMGTPGAEDPYEKLLKDAPFMSLRDVAKWEWQKAEGLKGPIMHIEIADREATMEIIGSLQRMGIKAEGRPVADSDSFMLRIEGKAMQRILAEQERQKQGPMALAASRSSTDLQELISRPWKVGSKDDVLSMRLAVGDGREAEWVIDALRQHGITASRDDKNVTHETTGLTSTLNRVRITGDDMMRALKLTKDPVPQTGQPAVARTRTPRPGPG